jgi:hypothetical protein
MQIKGVEGLSVSEVQNLVRQGGRFVVFSYCFSVLVMTFKRSSDIHFIRPGEGTFGKSLPYTALSFFVGWWGFPWGFIYTPWAIVENLGGGKNVTAQVMNSFGENSPAPLPPPAQDGPKVHVQ